MGVCMACVHGACVHGCVHGVCGVRAFFSFEFQQTSNDFDEHISPSN
jgi:hypothetical protein